MCHLCWGLTHQRSYLKWTKRKCLDWLSTQTTWSPYGLLDREPWEWKQTQGVHIQIWIIFARSLNIAGNSFFRIQGGQLLVSNHKLSCEIKLKFMLPMKLDCLTSECCITLMLNDKPYIYSWCWSAAKVIIMQSWSCHTTFSFLRMRNHYSL